MQTEQQHSLRLLRWMMAASVALPVALFVYASSVSWVSTQETADREIERTLDVAHEHALKVFETIDRSLSEINEMIRGKSDAEIKAQEQLYHLRLKVLADALPQIKSAWVFDTRGRTLANSMMQPAPDNDFSDRDYFRAHVRDDVGLYIGPTLEPRAPYQGEAFFSVSRRREAADGAFIGVIQASILPEYFESFYTRIGRTPGSFFALGLRDGSILARYPGLTKAAQLDPKGAVGRKIAANPASGLVTLISPTDGIERRLGYERLAGFPIYVAAGLETSAIRNRWLSSISVHLIFGVPATALLFLLLALALRRTSRLHIEAARRRDAEEALKHGQRLEALGQLTGGVAHDFNNLLTVIRSSVDMLQRPNLAPERRDRYTTAISDTVSRAAKLTAQLLAFARRQTLKPEVFDVGHCVLSVGDIIGTLTGSPVEILTRIPDEPCFIDADVGQFETALINIAVNARDAMRGEGRLTITVGTAAQIPSATLPASGVKAMGKVMGYVAVAIEDTGVGIAKEQFDRIFEPFFTTKEVGQGTGLGLSQVFGFAKQSGGEVVVASELNKGSTFTLYLPRVASPAPIQTPRTVPASPADGKGIAVLVVEDNRDVGRFTTDALTELGYEPTLFTSATEALDGLARHPNGYDVVFSDVVMPGMTGIEMAQEIRQRYPDLPLILTSGYSHVLAEKGTFGFELLQKPYSIEQLSQALNKAGHQRGVRRPAEQSGVT